MADLNFNGFLDVVSPLLLAIGGGILYSIRKSFETIPQNLSEELSKKMTWPAELDRKLQEIRGVERQEFRYKCYSKLWSKLTPLAIFKPDGINKMTVADLNLELTEWYFSEHGGLLLTFQARDFYFSLQELLKATSQSEEWETARFEEPKEVFGALAKKRKIPEITKMLKYLDDKNFEKWKLEGGELGKNWKEGIKKIAADWSQLDEKEKFATLQQVGSILRTCLTIDLESRNI